MSWKEPDFNLRKLYHPGGIYTHTPPRSTGECPCGCRDSTFIPRDCNPERVGIKDTPGMREEARLKAIQRRSEKEARAKEPKKQDVWKGAKVSTETVLLLAQDAVSTDFRGGYRYEECKNPRCERPHIHRQGLRVHAELVEARVYRKGSAVAAIRKGAKVNLHKKV